MVIFHSYVSLPEGTAFVEFSEFHRAAEEGWKLSSGSKKERQDNNGHVGKKTHFFLVNHILHIKKKCITCVCVCQTVCMF